MVFVPIATMKQQEKGMAKKAEIEALRNDDAFMSDLLGRWYDDAVAAKNGDKTKKARRIIATSITSEKTK